MTNQNKSSTEFWKHKRLSEMSHEEWESLCDGCGRCCLHKLEDDDDGKMYYTRAACELLDIANCRCTHYEQRQTLMPDCIQLSVEQAHYFDWLPPTCAYRLLAEGEDLPSWHPLISGDPMSVVTAGVSVRDFAVSEQDIDDLSEAVIQLPTPTDNAS
jgi:uncharacterized cysteine cluster protein YcgN (CxxCxxCC family)